MWFVKNRSWQFFIEVPQWFPSLILQPLIITATIGMLGCCRYDIVKDREVVQSQSVNTSYFKGSTLKIWTQSLIVRVPIVWNKLRS